MKSALSIFLICYFSLAALVPRMDVDRLQQIPDLVAHFLEHEGTDEAIGFIKFISLHYGNNHTEPADGHELPFQGHDCNISAHIFASIFSGLAGQLSLDPPFTELTDIYTFHLTAQHLSDIWQPPRA